MIDRPECFYMVHSEGVESPRTHYASRRSADAEAERLAKITLHKYYVLKAIGMKYTEIEMKPTVTVKGISIGNDDGLQ